MEQKKENDTDIVNFQTVNGQATYTNPTLKNDDSRK
jgi:hypothetical protein